MRHWRLKVQWWVVVLGQARLSLLCALVCHSRNSFWNCREGETASRFGSWWIEQGQGEIGRKIIYEALMDPSEEKVCAIKLVTCFQLIKLATGGCMGRAALPFIRKIRTKMLYWASCWLITVKKQYFTGVVCFLKYISWLLSCKLAHIPYVLSWSGDAAPLQGNKQRPG